MECKTEGTTVRGADGSLSIPGTPNGKPSELPPAAPDGTQKAGSARKDKTPASPAPGDASPGGPKKTEEN